MARAFYPFVDNGDPQPPQGHESASGEEGAGLSANTVSYPARIAVYDDAAAAPRVVIVDPTDVRSYLEEITSQVTALSHEQGGTIPFTVIREIVENLIHAYFIEPTISILDGGNTIRFSDQGPGIKEKDRALEYGTSTATEEMKHYIRGVGSGLPYVQQYMEQKGGCLLIEDNLSQGTVVTISTKPLHGHGNHADDSAAPALQQTQTALPQQPQPYAYNQYGMPIYVQQAYQPPYPQGYPQPLQNGYPAYPQQGMQAQQIPVQGAQNPAAAPMPAPQQYDGYQPGQGGYQQPVAQGYPTEQLQSANAAGQQAAGTTQQPAAPNPQRQMPGIAPRQDAPTGMAQPQVANGASQQGTQAAAEAQDGDPFAWIALTERGSMALDYLAAHESVGPSDLQRTYGGSQPTWTRELKMLEDDGLVKKEGQKRHLTNLGRAFIARKR